MALHAYYHYSLISRTPGASVYISVAALRQISRKKVRDRNQSSKPTAHNNHLLLLVLVCDSEL